MPIEDINSLRPIADLFEPQLLEEMQRQGTIHSLPAGTTLIKAGQLVQDMPIMLAGLLKIERFDDHGREIFLYYVNSLESCAMTFTCCMQQFPSEITAIVEEDAEILMVPKSMMDPWMAKYPSWKSFAMRNIRQRFNELLRTIDQIAFQKLDERLARYLIEKSRATGSTLLNISHQQIADELASSREVVSRLLKKLENDKKLLLYRNQIKLLQAQM